MIVKKFQGDVSVLRPIAVAWSKEANCDAMGLDFDMEAHLKDLQELVDNPDSELFVLEDENSPVGYIGITKFKSPLGKQFIANEHYYYVLPEKRGVSSVSLLRAVEQWAKLKGCSHILMNASYLASDLHDKVCRLYESLGMKKFESTYIKEV